MAMTRRTAIASTLGFPAILRAADPTRSLDEAMQGLLHKHALPGGALGIARKGQTVYAKGFGLANRERAEAVRADTRFRLASVTKPLTATAILKLCEQGRLALGDTVLPKLGLEPLSGHLVDPRWQQVTVRQLLQHCGGWDKEISGDPLFQSREISRDAGLAGPADAQTTVRWMLGRPLDYAPGTRYAYCNFGYCLLGRLIEAVTGESYAQAMQRLVITPCGAKGLELGHTLTPLPNESTYYHHDATLGPGIFPAHPEQVTWPYGTFSLEANDANGGFIASVQDVLCFLTRLSAETAEPLLQPSWFQAMCREAAPGFEGKPVHHALGWLVRPQGQGGHPNLWYIGSLPGTSALAVHLGNDLDWVALFNSRPRDYNAFSLEVQNVIHAAARQVTDWPS